MHDDFADDDEIGPEAIVGPEATEYGIVGPEAANAVVHAVAGPEAVNLSVHDEGDTDAAKVRAKDATVPAPKLNPQRPLTQNDSVMSWEEARPGNVAAKVVHQSSSGAGQAMGAGHCSTNVAMLKRKLQALKSKAEDIEFERHCRTHESPRARVWP